MNVNVNGVRFEDAPEGPACQVRGATLDHPLHSHGHDKRAPPIAGAASGWIIHSNSAGMTSIPLRPSEGPACRVRCTTFDHPLRFGGHDGRAPRLARCSTSKT